MSSKYKQAGVDVEAGYEAVSLMRKHVEKTMRREVLGGIGSFGGAFELDLECKNITKPVLVSGTDGVGTKLKLAHLMDKHDTIGIDCVAMCVNDIACSGAEPLLFLDYIACGKNEPTKIEAIVKGVSDGCVQAGCALVGGETAEMPGFYAEDEYDVAGFSVGVVDKSKMISTNSQVEGDVLVGIQSSGVHSNGFSLVRKIFDIDNNAKVLDKKYDDLGKTLGEELLTPTFIYTKVMNKITDAGLSKGFMHITGGGFIENIPRGLKDGLCAKVLKENWVNMPIFNIMQKEAEMSDAEMYNTFNMGIGMICVVAKENVSDVTEIISESGFKAHITGQLGKGSGVHFV
jgi:phosphoribosylformylglycinamidine cyclo-ligase